MVTPFLKEQKTRSVTTLSFRQNSTSELYKSRQRHHKSWVTGDCPRNHYNNSNEFNQFNHGTQNIQEIPYQVTSTHRRNTSSYMVLPSVVLFNKNSNVPTNIRKAPICGFIKNYLIIVELLNAERWTD